MKTLAKLISLCVVFFMVSSCATLNIHTYSIKNLDGKGIVDNANFSVTYENEFMVLYDAYGTFTIRNNKDSVLYIDMANSYFIDTEGQAERLFTNTIQTTYSSTTTGASFNLGSVARVLGAGPVASTLAGGISVGGASTEGTAVQRIEDRYIGIPPYSSVKIKFPTLGKNAPLNKKKGNYRYDWPSESQILSYTYTAENPKWVMIRNQFVLDGIIVKDVADEGDRIVVMNDRKSVGYKDSRPGRTAALAFGGIGVVLGTVLILKAK